MANPIDSGIRTILKEHLGLDPDRAHNMPTSTHLFDDLDADSLDVVEVCMALEDHFKVSLPDTVTDRVNTLEDLIREVTRQTGLPA